MVMKGFLLGSWRGQIRLRALAAQKLYISLDLIYNLHSESSVVEGPAVCIVSNTIQSVRGIYNQNTDPCVHFYSYFNTFID